MVLSCKFFVPLSALQAGFCTTKCGTNCATKDNNKQNNNVMIKKSFYEAPESELIMVRFEEGFLTTSPDSGIPSVTGNDVEDDTDDWNQPGN